MWCDGCLDDFGLFLLLWLSLLIAASLTAAVAASAACWVLMALKGNTTSYRKAVWLTGSAGFLAGFVVSAATIVGLSTIDNSLPYWTWAMMVFSPSTTYIIPPILTSVVAANTTPGLSMRAGLSIGGAFGAVACGLRWAANAIYSTTDHILDSPVPVNLVLVFVVEAVIWAAIGLLAILAAGEIRRGITYGHSHDPG